jgi:glutamate-1-semialdehyde 2,1-aminomutase
LKDLYFFHLVEAGVYLARRGYLTLSLPLSEEDISHFVQATRSFVERYRALLPTSR